MTIVLYPDQRLTAKAMPRAVDEDLRAVGAKLLEAARAAQAFGLAAVHVGEVAPVVVLSTASDPARRAYRLLYNPRVEAVADELVSGTEGSVSLPGIEVEVLRPAWTEIGYEDGEGLPQRARFEGLAARIALHEIEQMNGVFFLSRVSRLRREMALKKWKKQAG